MDERIEELEDAFYKLYENPEDKYPHDSKEGYDGAKMIELDDISFNKIPGFENCTDEEIQKVKQKLRIDGNFWLKKSDWK